MMKSLECLTKKELQKTKQTEISIEKVRKTLIMFIKRKGHDSSFNS